MNRKLKCRICRRAKPEEAFRPRADTKRGRRSECVPCGKVLSREYYRGNRRKVIKRVTQRRASL